MSAFATPLKKIHDGPDVEFFLKSLAYRDLMTFILQLNHAMVPRKTSDGTVQTWPLDSPDILASEPVTKLQLLIDTLRSYIDEAPPDTGPRRFGNISFRLWSDLVSQRTEQLLLDILPLDLHSALPEITAYLLGSFGSPQRLDYGTGHELSFIAFLGSLWKLNFFSESDSGNEERAIVIGVFQRYLTLIRQLITKYTLEPAGSHGVWGLDDNSFLPYLFGSAQLCPPISDGQETPIEGSLPNAPEPSSISQRNLVDREKGSNLYFSAIGFINDVKRGPFGEHSPMLYDISGVKDGWGKINKGMIKMYNGEVLAKFPVVQHFPFGALYRWERDPEAKESAVKGGGSVHTANQPLRNPLGPSARTDAMSGNAAGMLPPGRTGGTAAPWAARPSGPPVGMANGVTRAPWAKDTPSTPKPTRRPAPFVTNTAPNDLLPAPSPIPRPSAPTPRSMMRDEPLPEE